MVPPQRRVFLMHCVSLLLGPLLCSLHARAFSDPPLALSALPFHPGLAPLSLLYSPLPPFPAFPSVTYNMSNSMARPVKGPEGTDSSVTEFPHSPLVLVIRLPSPEDLALTAGKLLQVVGPTGRPTPIFRQLKRRETIAPSSRQTPVL